MRRTRSVARELALNVLYQWDSAGLPFEEALETALEFTDLSAIESKGSNKADEVRDYARLLALGVKNAIRDLDECISRLAEGWAIDRQPAVDRNILRIAMYETKYVDSVPPVVAVDEAVELAKKFSTAESGKFINGVLAGYLRERQQQPEEKKVGGSDT